MEHLFGICNIITVKRLWIRQIKGREMNHRERIEAVLNGHKPDRMPVSFWRHFYDSESTAEQLSSAMLKFQDKYDWDFMKINPRASYHLEDWGNKYKYTGKPEDKPERLAFAVEKSSDWDKIYRLKPTEATVLKEHIDAVEIIRKASANDLPIVMTVFNPISIAGDLVKDDPFLVDQIRSNPDALHQALENITLTFIDFIKEIMKKGIDGIFFATTQWASTALITEDEYRQFGRKYDLMLLEEIIPMTRLNILHVCSHHNMLSMFTDYPIRIVNWDINESSNPDAPQGAKMLPDKVVLGGVERKGLLQDGSEDELRKMVSDYYAFSKENPFMLGPDCSIPVTTPDRNLEIIQSEIEKFSG
ncbi:MAG: hypothetical protein GF404_08990 [candidate division Zixibacteria bacterium]|nr:hypothetical protein [candidate division Zixibacteria bacterium]